MHLVILLFALFASIFTFSKVTLSFAEPFFLIGSRMTVAGIILLAHQWFFHRSEFRKIESKHIPSLFLLALFAIYITNLAEIWSLTEMDSSKTCLLYSLSPFLSALIAFFVLGETLNGKKWIGMIVGFIGLIPITFLKTGTEVSTVLHFSFGEICMLVAVATSVYGWILLKKCVQALDTSPIMANGIAMLIGGSLALLTSYYSGENWQPLPVSEYTPFIINTLAMLAISNIICYNLYGFLLKRFSATFMSFAGLVTPLFAAFFGWVALGETITWHFFASLVLFSVGLYIFYGEELKNEPMRVQEQSA